MGVCINYLDSSLCSEWRKIKKASIATDLFVKIFEGNYYLAITYLSWESVEYSHSHHGVILPKEPGVQVQSSRDLVGCGFQLSSSSHGSVETVPDIYTQDR